METEINIVEILKDKPVNTKLYSPLYGDVYFSHIGVRNDIVEDGLPPYGEEVFVTSKIAPDNVYKNRRVECTTVPKDGNDFIILWEGRMARITHWKPIDKLEE